MTQAGASRTDKSKICCPFHDDKNPSAQIKQAASGIWYFHCYVCDISYDVWAVKARVLGKDVGEVLKDETQQIQDRPQVRSSPKAEKPKQSFATIEDLIASYRQRNPQDEIAEVNKYTNPATNEIELCTLRIHPNKRSEDKTFRQISRNEHGGWEYSGIKGKAPLFNRTRVQQCDRILIVEGEKCVRAVTQIGATNLAATTAPGGAMNAGRADWTPLAGKTCYIWRDDDEPGKAYETEIINALKRLTPPPNIYRIRVEELELGPKGDVADYLNDPAMTNAEKVHSIELCLRDAEQIGGTSALGDKFARIIAGEFRSIPFPQKPCLSELSKAIMPGCLTTIVGEPGAGKSFFVLEDFWRWHLQHGESVRLLMLEDDDAFHQQRALAQMSGSADILDPEFVKAHPEWAIGIFNDYNDRLNKFSRFMETADGQMTLTEIAAWVTKHAEAGVRIIGVDPITAAKASDKPWIDDQKFLFEVKPVLERTGASLILTTHPRIGQAGRPSLSGMAGGAAYPRFSQCVLWLRNLDKDAEGRVWEGYGWVPVTYKQVVQIRKARNGKGQARHVAVKLNFQNLCFDEIGELETPSE